MEHLSEQQLYDYVLDQAALPAAEAEHLAICAACQQQIAALQRLTKQLAQLRRNQPAPATLTRYQQLFAAVQQQPTPLRQWVQQLRAQLTWDSRQQGALQGVRSGGAAPTYRLLYETSAAEVEMMITPSAQRCAIEGDIMLLATSTFTLPALVQLLSVDAATAYETESTQAGRFRLERIAPGPYTLLLTPATGAVLEIEDLEIT